MLLFGQRVDAYRITGCVNSPGSGNLPDVLWLSGSHHVDIQMLTAFNAGFMTEITIHQTSQVGLTHVIVFTKYFSVGWRRCRKPSGATAAVRGIPGFLTTTLEVMIRIDWVRIVPRYVVNLLILFINRSTRSQAMSSTRGPLLPNCEYSPSMLKSIARRLRRGWGRFGICRHM
ncbi:MAG: hypothetical protein GPOALKHO_000778 [Sodalis sp.]|nr:MAG: hypothetical protein GPOALKHO_000778 [Sodalis sp.]